uniref:BED-type domain-containing protein n=1 Tax=Chenopodium quinoa TaxID=63459 RepID=A0A803N8R0_CHEQI
MENDPLFTGIERVVEDVIDEQVREDEIEELNPFAKRQRKKTSWVWRHLEFVTYSTGIIKVKCKNCSTLFKYTEGGPTTQYRRHLMSCSMGKSNGKQQLGFQISTPQSENNKGLENWKYDHAKIRELMAHMIIVHELPFMFAEYEVFNMLMKASAPEYEKVSRVTAKNICMTSYDIEKKRTKGLLKQANRVCITTDIWRSDSQKIEYMAITFEWEIESKLACITVDNATYNDVVVRTLKDSISCQAILPYGGKLFHVRCCANILNILVHDGLEEIKDVIYKVRESVKHVITSIARLNIFSEICKQLKLPGRRLVLDCCTRWNATYHMLSVAFEFRGVFPRYKNREPSYNLFPSDEEWKKVEVVCTFLSLFNQATEIISVASESTFSAGGIVIDSYRASLGTSTIQMLMCTEDWLRSFYGIKRKQKVIEEFKIIDLP